MYAYNNIQVYNIKVYCKNKNYTVATIFATMKRRVVLTKKEAIFSSN